VKPPPQHDVPEELEVTVGNVRIEQRVTETKLQQTRVREPSAPEERRQVEAADTDIAGTGAGRVVARERVEIRVGTAAERAGRGDIAEDRISERLVVPLRELKQPVVGLHQQVRPDDSIEQSQSDDPIDPNIRTAVLTRRHG
jgi:hypothetical protein